MSKRSSLGVAERSALVLRLLSKEEPAAQIARRAGIAEATLYRWRDQFLEAGRARLAGLGPDRSREREVQLLRRALANRDQVIGELTIANRVLKKVQGDDVL